MSTEQTGAACQPTEIGQVTNRLHNSKGVLSQKSSQLVEQISPILGGAVPTACSEKAVNPKYESSLAIELDGINDSIKAAIDTIQSALDRIKI